MGQIEKVAVIGAGNMGSGIAQKSAQELFDVQMVDREEEWVERGHSIVSSFLQEAEDRRIFSSKQVGEIKSRITGVVGTENVDPSTDLVIEAVFEDFEVKKVVFETLNDVCDKHTILASNTSSLSVDELALATGRPDRFVGLHFFYHPAKNRLVEVIPATRSSEASIKSVEQYCKAMGKVVIVCKDRPGFVVNRFFVPWLNEACLLLEEGIGTTAQIDAIARSAFSIGMGPFALMNLTGPPIALHSTDYLSKQLHTPRYAGSAILRKLVEKGEMWEIGDSEEYDEHTRKIISERLLGQVFSVSAQIVDEEICSMEDVDRGAKVGLRWEKGPFELANEIGIKKASQMAVSYSALAGLELPEWFSSRAKEFEFSYVDLTLEGEVARVRLNRPEAMNALNVDLVSQLGELVKSINSMPDITTIVFEGAGKAFVAGADVKFFVDKLRDDSFEEIYEFTAHGHEVLNSIENSEKVTIALTTGLALGGGLELALSCDYRIGTRRTQFRFPETSIGIYPGLGGTQRTARICGLECARYAVMAGNFMSSETASDIGLLTHNVDPSDVEEIVKSLMGKKPNEKYPGRPSNPESDIVRFATEFYSDKNVPLLELGKVPSDYDSEDPLVSRQGKSLSRVAPIALKIASELITDVRSGSSLEQGLKLELDRLEEIFSTEDAIEGLSALIEGRRPSYTSS
ncbi:MAG: 3-hydroxyacyl-CoA dehydrogenase/enoyl-CoA hydratase family protein [Candidatus Thalassarchaeaceae archaeon]|nr:3-hydroxyacyl-CoA dehydrogenase/enoyl-CoA hydratase family protein [Candidatus Thalassarchaeaceae archaeon]